MTRRNSLEKVRQRRALRGQLTETGPVMEAAAAFLAVRSRSVAETSRRLVRLGYPLPLVEEVVTQLVETNYLDDEAFARAWVDSRDRRRPRGERGLRRELAIKGVPRGIVDEVMDEREESAAGEDPDLAAAQVLLAKRMATFLREPDLRKRRSKAYALLARNGFDSDTCRSAVETGLGHKDEPLGAVE